LPVSSLILRIYFSFLRFATQQSARNVERALAHTRFYQRQKQYEYSGKLER